MPNIVTRNIVTSNYKSSDMKINGGLHASSSFNWIFPLILITTCWFRAASGQCGFACTLNYDPICGSDGVTYGNECEMRAANCRSERSVTQAHRGRCREAPGQCGFACPLNMDPICGSDGVTYSNECGMRAANCRSETNVTKAYRGRCREGTTERSCDSVCPANYDPVCGSDGKTYGNECELLSRRCVTKTRLRVVCKGVCRRSRSRRLTCRRYTLDN